jgi:hypothetical protein
MLEGLRRATNSIANSNTGCGVKHSPNICLRRAVVLGKNESFGNVGAAGEDFGEELFLEGFDDGADLVFAHWSWLLITADCIN